MITETIDRLFLELSQVTTAKTRREAILENALREVLIDIDAFGDVSKFVNLASIKTAQKLLAIKQ